MLRAKCTALALSISLIAPLALAQPAEPEPPPPPAPPTDPATDLDRAEQLYREGKALVAENNLEGAYAKYAEAFTLKQSYDIAANLGAVELALGKYRDAAEHLDFAIRRSPVNDDPEKRQKVKDKLAEAKQHVGTFRVTVNMEGAAVTCDTRPAVQLDAVFVDPGSHEIRATITGHPDGVVKIDITAGKTLDVTITIPPTKPNGNGNGDHKPPPSDGLSIIWPIAAGVITVAAAGAGVAMFFIGKGKADDARTLEAEHQANGDCSAAAPCTDIGESFDDADQFYNTSAGLFIGAGIALLATGALTGVYLATNESESAMFIPTVSPTMAGLTFITPF